ncbi:hypothetical protein [Aeromicrobium sp.]|uniref:hypothetical protein n=1 Tax=Aeromicrobium sp. TaxID=1871063 RepID=UPI003C37C694
MRFQIKMLLAAGIAAAALTATGGPASAAHCNDSGGPGNSDFSSHVQANNGPGGHNEGDHQGWSSCNPNAKSGGR